MEFCGVPPRSMDNSIDLILMLQTFTSENLTLLSGRCGPSAISKLRGAFYLHNTPTGNSAILDLQRNYATHQPTSACEIFQS